MYKLNTLLDETLYVLQPGEDDSVIGSGKPPELIEADLQNGIARFGGRWRQPSYLHAYAKAAAALVQQAQQTKSLDALGLPIFYLQRHAMELLLKRLISWFVDIADARDALGQNNNGRPTSDEKKRFEHHHDLQNLWSDLRSLSRHFKLGDPPEEIGAFVVQAAQFEQTTTWSRYATLKKKEQLIRHVEKEIELPIVLLQERLEAAVTATTSKNGFDDCYEVDLYREWSFHQLCFSESSGQNQ